MCRRPDTVPNRVCATRSTVPYIKLLVQKLYDEASIYRRRLHDAQVPLEPQLHVHRVLLRENLLISP